MDAGIEDPAVTHRRLRVELRRLRQDRELNQADVARAMDWSTSKLIRIEHGDVRISPSDLRVLLGYYGVDEPAEVEEMVEMARAARRDAWAEYRGLLSKQFLTYVAFESSAKYIRRFDSTLVPGIFQTEEYARAVLENTYGYSGRSVDRRWASRQRRQELHERDNPPQMVTILDEAVIRRDVGGRGVMRRQLERLMQWSEEPHVVLRVLPFDVGAQPGMLGPFAVLDFHDPRDDDFVFIEYPTGESVSFDHPEDTAPYLERFFALEEIALSPAKTRALIEQAIEHPEVVALTKGGSTSG